MTLSWTILPQPATPIKSKGTILVLEKEKPYPCNKGEFKSKDGIHLIFPDIILDKKAYKKIVASIVEKDKIKNKLKGLINA